MKKYIYLADSNKGKYLYLANGTTESSNSKLIISTGINQPQIWLSASEAREARDFINSWLGQQYHKPELLKEKEKEMSSETVTLKKEDLLKAHSEGCSATKKALENLYPEVFKKQFRQGQVFLGRYSGDPYIVNINSEDGKAELIAFPTCIREIPDGYRDYTQAKNGIIKIAVKDGIAREVIWREECEI